MLAKIAHSRSPPTSLTIRNLPDALQRAPHARAARHGRRTEAEARDALEKAVKPVERVRLGDALAGLRRELGLTEQDFAALGRMRGRTPAEPLKLD